MLSVVRVRGFASGLRPGIRLAAVETRLTEEQDRWALWAPVFFGVGIAVYFALPYEPVLWSAPVTIAAIVGGMRFGRLSLGVLGTLACFAIILASAGFGWATLRTLVVEEPTLLRDAGVTRLEAAVSEVEAFSDGPRVLLSNVRYLWDEPSPAPRTVRLKLRKGERIDVGQVIRLTAVLKPPPRPVYPGAYDFARRAWFEGLGAVGFSLSTAETVESDSQGAGYRLAFSARMAALRQTINRRVRTAVPGERGAIAAALITGDRSGISEESLSALRNSGLAHLLAISGLHIGLVAVSVFASIRTALSLSEYLALRWPIKKWSAFAALLATLSYLLLAGSTPPTQRAALMTGLVLVAVMADRQAISMRAVMIAASVLLLLRPESIVGASFQLSFAAVVALVAVYEFWRPFSERFEDAGGSRAVEVLRRGVAYLVLIASTTLIAGTSTAPFAWHHFGQVANYGVIGNLAAIPLMAWLVMPMGVLGTLLLPFGLEYWPLQAMGFGISLVLDIAEWVARLPGATLHLPATPVWAPSLIALGGLWLAIWRGRWRWWGAAPVLAGLVLPFQVVQPHAIVSETGRLIAFRTEAGMLSYSNDGRERFAAGVWSAQTGYPKGGDWREWMMERNSGTGLTCGPLGCVYENSDGDIAVSRDPRTLSEDCRAAAVVIADIAVPWNLKRTVCRDTLLIDPPKWIVQGTHAIYLKDGEASALSVGSERGSRPWTKSR